MVGEWSRFTLDELCSQITDGKHGDCLDQAGSGFFFLSVKDVLDERLEYENARQITERDFLEAHRRTNLEPGDVLFTNSGTIGRMAIAKDDPRTCRTTFQKSVAILKPARDLIEPHFLYYLLRFDNAKLSEFASGTTQKNLLLKDLRAFGVRIPPLHEQRAIAHILGSLDDKIALNRRMNRTLEELAAAIFKSWFVDFDPVVARAEGRQPFGMDAATAVLFPAAFEESKMGSAPVGWRVGTVGEVFDLTMGQSPPGTTYNEEGLGLPFYQGRTDFGFRFPTRRVYCTAPTRFAEPGDTLVSVRAPVGDVNMAGEHCAIGRGLAAVRHKGGSRSFTYYTMRSLSEEFEVFEGEGTLFGSISSGGFRNIKVVIPDPRVIAAYERLAYPLDQNIESNERESITLAAIRDALLPKLMSGEIRVR